MAVASTSMCRKYSVYGLGESGRPQEDTVGELLGFPNVMVCGPAHDWMQEHSPRIPEFCAVCDPDPVMANVI